MEKETIDIVRMSSELSISKTELRKILGIGAKTNNVCSVSTISQIRAMYAESKAGSDEEQSIIERWNELSLIEVENAKTARQARLAHDSSHPDSEARDLASCLWNKLSLAEVNAAGDFESLKEAYIETPPKSEVRRLAIKKLAELKKKKK